MGARIKGVEPAVANLQNMAERSSEGARRELEKGAYAIRDLARRMAPRKSGTLEEAIDVEEDRGGFAGRKQFFVAIQDQRNPEGQSAQDYGLIMHEGADVGFPYGLGPGSEEKQRQDPTVQVGRKFMDRAVYELEDAIRARIEEAISTGIGH